MLRLGDTRQSYLGVKVHTVNLPQELAQKTKQERGLLIFEVESGTVAERAGLMLGDTLISVNDEPFQNQDDLVNLLSGDKAGQNAIIRFIRVGKIYRVKAKLD
jgi:S1-C subfamily serine protease